MSNEKPLRPFLSVVIIILTLFLLVFLQMEERRLGYEVLTASRVQKKLLEERRLKEMKLVAATRPQQLEKIATTRLTLKKIQSNQIIRLPATSMTRAEGKKSGALN